MHRLWNRAKIITHTHVWQAGFVAMALRQLRKFFDTATLKIKLSD